MANAAAKKAAQARAAASATYFPIVAGLNVIHLLVRLYQWDAFASSRSNIVLNALLIGLTVFAYKGILDDYAESASKSTTKVGGGKSNEKLAGGASLDLLGLVVLVQFGSALISDKFYWILAILPFWGAYKIYQMVYGAKNLMGGGSGGGGRGYGSMAPSMAPSAGMDGTTDAADERRKKRAERRRMKRG